MIDKNLSQIIDEMQAEMAVSCTEAKNDFVVMFNALLSAEAQIIQNQMTMMECLGKLVKDDEEYLVFLNKTIDKNNEMVNKMFEVINQGNGTD